MLTSLVLSNRLEQAGCDADTTDPLCIKNLRVYLPARTRFPAAGKLVVYFTVLDLAADPKTKLPALQVTFALKTGEDFRDEIGWEPRISLEEGTRRSLDFYKENLSYYL